MPCTTPKPSATLAIPTMAPVATGSRPSPKAIGERYTASSRVMTSTLLITDSLLAAPSILSREATAKTPGPLKRSESSRAEAACDAVTAAANA